MNDDASTPGPVGSPVDRGVRSCGDISFDDDGDVTMDWRIGDEMLTITVSQIGHLHYAWRTPGSVEPSGHGTLYAHPAVYEILSRIALATDGA